MRDDLLDAQAAVDWTIAQLPAFSERIDAWIATNLEVVVRELPPPSPNDLIVVVEKGELPAAFNVEAGAYINVLRSSLDILATILGHRHQVLFPHKWYWPVAETAADFAANRNHAGVALMNGLPADDRLIIESLKPYKGGHRTIWRLHSLDIMRKHRRLLAVHVTPSTFSLEGTKELGEAFGPVAGGFMRADYEYVFGTIRKGMTGYNTQASFDITFNEPALADHDVVIALEVFAEDVSAIIKRFD